MNKSSSIYFSDQNFYHNVTQILAELNLTFFFVRTFCHKVSLKTITRILVGKVAGFTLVLFIFPNSSTYYRWWRQINASKCYLEIFRKEAWIVWKKSKGRSRNWYVNSNGWRHNAGVCPKSLWSQFCKL